MTTSLEIRQAQPRHESANWFALNFQCHSCRGVFGVDADEVVGWLGSFNCILCGTPLFLSDAQDTLALQVYRADRTESPLTNLLGKGWRVVDDVLLAPEGVDLVVLPALYDTCRTCGVKLYGNAGEPYCTACVPTLRVSNG